MLNYKYKIISCPIVGHDAFRGFKINQQNQVDVIYVQKVVVFINSSIQLFLSSKYHQPYIIIIQSTYTNYFSPHTLCNNIKLNSLTHYHVYVQVKVCKNWSSRCGQAGLENNGAINMSLHSNPVEPQPLTQLLLCSCKMLIWCGF